jgi:HSP20 family protein
MPLPVRRHVAPAWFADRFDWLESPWFSLMPFGPGQAFRVEDYAEDGKYLVRAELPGIDPDKDVEVTVDSGLLTIHAERNEETREDRHSEFRYGSMTRSFSLPEGADPEKVTARYAKGIVEVAIPLQKQVKSAARRVTIERAI